MLATMRLSLADEKMEGFPISSDGAHALVYTHPQLSSKALLSLLALARSPSTSPKKVSSLVSNPTTHGTPHLPAFIQQHHPAPPNSSFHFIPDTPVPFICPSPVPSPPPRWRKASLLTGWQSPSPIKDSVSPGDTWKLDRMVFLPIFFTAEKTQTQDHIYCNVSVPKFVLKKKK